MEDYTKINWLNKPITSTPMNSTNLNHMDNQIHKLTSDKADKDDIPTKTSELTNDSAYQTLTEVNTIVSSAISALGNLLVFKGIIANYTSLQALASPKTGDVWQVTDDSDSSTPHGANSEYYYDGTNWDYFSSAQVVELTDYYKKSESDARYILNTSIKALRYNGGEFEYTTNGTTWTTLLSGHDGANGATFVPSVDDDGYISWENDKSLPNPQTKNIKGAKGDTGYSPQVSVYENTSTSYKLLIKPYEDGTQQIITPNLRGADGYGSGDMLKATYDSNNNGIVDTAEKVNHTLSIKSGSTTYTFNGSADVSVDVASSGGGSTFISSFAFDDGSTTPSIAVGDFAFD